MAKALTRLTLALLAASVCAPPSAAQTPPAPAPASETPAGWVEVAPAGEEFRARMPREPLSVEEGVSAGGLSASGRRYTATGEGGARYVVWSLKGGSGFAGAAKGGSASGPNYDDEYNSLDLVAEAAWELLVRPEVERLKRGVLRKLIPKDFTPQLWLVRDDFKVGTHRAREYRLRLEKEGGPVYVSSDGERIYVVAAVAPDAQAAESKLFVESFALKPFETPRAGGGDRPARGGYVGPVGAGGIEYGGGGGGAGVDYTRPFRQVEVTKKARLTHKPKADFTEAARKFDVLGVVRLRAVLSRTGEVTNLVVVKPLPHGLTEKALDAARRIRFTPAEKDGHIVSQYVALEYNFNIY